MDKKGKNCVTVLKVRYSFVPAILAAFIIVALAVLLPACTVAPVSNPSPAPGQTTTTVTVTQTSVPAAASSPSQSPLSTPTPTVSPISNQSTDFVAAVGQVLPSVVQIEMTFGQQGAPGDPQAKGGAGTGWVYKSGIVVTNNHVVDGAQTISIVFPDGTKRTPSAVQASPSKDVAVLKVDTGNLPALVTGDSSRLAPGQPVAAIGNALNLGIRVTVGVVSQLDVPANYDKISLTGLIETDAAINPGNSGGVLIDIFGEVIGIPNAGLDDPNLDVENFSYAIAINGAKPVIQDLISRMP